MVTQIVGMQQILITVVFLSCLIGLLVFLRMKGGSIRANLQKGQRIKVIEETAVGPAERLRLITIDDRDFLMLSGKGIQPSLLPLSLAAAQIPKLPVETTFAPGIQPSNKLETSKPVADQPPLELTNPAFQLGKQTADAQASQDMDPAEVAAFAAKFKGWRKK